MLARTQIGGKYDEADLSLFDLKRRMEVAGIEVTYPASDGIVCTVDGRGYTFNPRTTSFLDIETDYYRSIAESDFHTVNNRFLGRMGYVGASAALEMTYAMMHGRPILLMHQPDFAASVDPICAEIISERAGLLHVHDLTQMDIPAIVETASFIKDRSVDYNINTRLGGWIVGKVEQVFEEIQNL